jgi:hypothetical protein
MATQEQAEKEMVAALRTLRGILIQGPRRTYPCGLYEHPEAKKVQAKIEVLVPHLAHLDPPGGPYFRDFLPCDVLPITQLPAHWEVLRELDQYIENFGGKQKTPKRPAIALTEEDKAILEALADEYPMAVNQPDLADQLNLPRQKISERIRWLESKRFVKRPEGTQRKGHAITPAGLSNIGRSVEGPH